MRAARNFILIYSNAFDDDFVAGFVWEPDFG